MVKVCADMPQEDESCVQQGLFLIALVVSCVHSERVISLCQVAALAVLSGDVEVSSFIKHRVIVPRVRVNFLLFHLLLNCPVW